MNQPESPLGGPSPFYAKVPADKYPSPVVPGSLSKAAAAMEAHIETLKREASQVTAVKQALAEIRDWIDYHGDLSSNDYMAIDSILDGATQ